MYIVDYSENRVLKVSQSESIKMSSFISAT